MAHTDRETTGCFESLNNKYRNLRRKTEERPIEMRMGIPRPPEADQKIEIKEKTPEAKIWADRNFNEIQRLTESLSTPMVTFDNRLIQKSQIENDQQFNQEVWNKFFNHNSIAQNSIVPNSIFPSTQFSHPSSSFLSRGPSEVSFFGQNRFGRSFDQKTPIGTYPFYDVPTYYSAAIRN